MAVKKVYNVLSNEEIISFNSLVSNIKVPLHPDGSYIYDTEAESLKCTISKTLGRLQTSLGTSLSFKTTYEKLVDLCKTSYNLTSETEVEVSSVAYVDYDAKYGTPNLPPHFDGDSSEFILNYQLESNTSWDIGVDFITYPMENNSAVIFQPNKDIHWRPFKKFNDGEYVRMIFFRFSIVDDENIVDNSHLRYNLSDKVYKDVNDFRNSLRLLDNI